MYVITIWTHGVDVPKNILHSNLKPDIILDAGTINLEIFISDIGWFGLKKLELWTPGGYTLVLYWNWKKLNVSWTALL